MPGNFKTFYETTGDTSLTNSLLAVQDLSQKLVEIHVGPTWYVTLLAAQLEVVSLVTY